MEQTKYNLQPHIKDWFANLSDVLETKLLYFGSIQRGDYFPGKSDIDVDVFTDNIKRTMLKLQHFLQINPAKFKRFVWNLPTKNVVYGHKVMYKDASGDFSVEFSIYDEKYRDHVIKEHMDKITLPFYIIWALIILKTLHYKLHLINKDVFRYCKKKLLSFFIGLPDDDFVVLDVTENHAKPIQR